MSTKLQCMLEELLRESFDDAELCRFLVLHYRDVHDALPAHTSVAIRTHHAVLALTRRGYLDEAFFDRLRRERPRLHLRIADVEQACVRPRPAALSSRRAPRSIGFGVSLVLLLGAWGAWGWIDLDNMRNDVSTPPSPDERVESTDQNTLLAPALVTSPAIRSRLACAPGMVLITRPAPDQPICVDQDEVSRKQFGLHCVGRREYRRDERRSERHEFCTAGLQEAEAERRPATGLSPREAAQHCAALGKRLPSGSEWTVVATAELGDRDVEDLLEFVNVCGKECNRDWKPGDYVHLDPYPETAPVGMLGVPQDGRPTIRDLFGNASEIVATEQGFRACGGGWASTRRGSLHPGMCLEARNMVLPAEIISYDGDLGFRCVSEPMTVPD